MTPAKPLTPDRIAEIRLMYGRKPYVAPLLVRIAELEKALRPFADLYEHREELSWPGRIDGEPLDDGDSAECAIYLGDLRNAAQALSTTPEDKDNG